MTFRQEKLIENYVRTKVRSMLKEEWDIDDEDEDEDERFTSSDINDSWSHGSKVITDDIRKFLNGQYFHDHEPTSRNTSITDKYIKSIMSGIAQHKKDRTTPGKADLQKTRLIRDK